LWSQSFRSTAGQLATSFAGASAVWLDGTDQVPRFCPVRITGSVSLAAGGSGPALNALSAWRWTGKGFREIPFQVDEVFTRYLNNDASNFAIYSGSDQHTTYAYDREGFRFTANDSDPCHAVPALDPASDDPQPGGEPTTPDPISGLDDNDELVFMASDAGPPAPPTRPCRRGSSRRGSSRSPTRSPAPSPTRT
jgi:hypothetical protein